MNPRVLAAVLAVLALALPACGEEDRGTPQPSSRLVDLSGNPPYVNSLVVQDDGSFLLTTNRGFWRVPRDGGAAQRISATVRADEGSSPVGTFLEIDRTGPDELLGSGHPDDEDALPPYLGLMRSTDDGRTWSVVSRLGEADLHQIRRVGDRLYAFDAVLSAMLVSEDGGRTWLDSRAPEGLLVDFVVDPADPDTVLAAGEEQLYRSEDGGESWRPAGRARAARLAWPDGGGVLRADEDGRFQASPDGGQTWEERGTVPGEPWALVAASPERAFLALRDGTILETDDGGASFEERFRP